MKNPQALRAHLVEALPALARDPDKLIIFADAGHIVAARGKSLSFEYQYTLSAILLDHADDPTPLIVALLEWVEANQPDLLENMDKRRDGIRFEVDFNNHESIDLSVEIDVTERVIAPRRAVEQANDG